MKSNKRREINKKIFFIAYSKFPFRILKKEIFNKKKIYFENRPKKKNNK